MAKELIGYDNDCRSCETCQGCGRDKEYPVYRWACEGCGDEPKDHYGDIELYKFNGLELCKECLLYEWLKTTPLEKINAKLQEYEVHELLKDEFEKVETEKE